MDKDSFYQEKRKYERYDTKAKIRFYFPYDFRTRMEYRVKNKTNERTSFGKYAAVSRNISADGLSFTSEKKLNQGDSLHLEMFLPNLKEPIQMDGEVRWSQANCLESKEKGTFDTGLKLITINGKPVHETIYYDEKYHVSWSTVLESVIGTYKKLIQKERKIGVRPQRF